jgi:hypothetical protein
MEIMTSGFERRHIIGVHTAGTFVVKTTLLLDTSRATVSKVTSAYTGHRKTTSMRRSYEQKSTLTERDCHIQKNCFKSHRNTAAPVTAELNIHLEDPVSAKVV